MRAEPESIAEHLDVDRVFSATKMAESGDTRDLFTLYRDVIATDSHLQGEIHKRKMAVLGDRMTVHPWDKKDPFDKSAAEQIEEMINACRTWKAACIHLLDGFIYPVSIVEKVFYYDTFAARWNIKSLLPVSYHLLDYTTGQLRIKDVDPDSGMILSSTHEINPARYIVHRGHMLSAPDTWGGPMRSILYWWLLATMSRDWWGRFLERYGSAFMVGHYPSGDQESRNVLARAFSLSTKLGGLVVNDKTKVEIQQAATSQSGDSYEKFITICNREKSKLIVGQTLSAEAQSTGMNSGVSDMQEGVRQDLRMWDASSLADTMRYQLFEQYVQVNNLSGHVPVLTWGSVSTSELQAKSDLLVSLKQAGYRLTDDELENLSEELGMSLEREQVVPGGGGQLSPFLSSYSAINRRSRSATRSR
jgi:phage gp29-like protein